MLTLLDTVRLDGATLYRDVVPGTGQRTARFYVQPDAPRLAVAPDGRPELDLVWYRAPAGDADVARRSGGLLTVTVELTLPETERAGLADALRAALPQEDLGGLELAPMPYLDGTVELTLATDPAGDPGTSPGPLPARLQGDQRATVVVELSRDGAGLLAELIDAGAPLLHARYELGFAVQLEDVSLRVWCDGARAHALAAGADGLGVPDPVALAGTLVAEQAAGVELVSTRPLPPAYQDRLTELGQTLVAAALAQALWEPGADGAAPRLRPYDPGFETTLNHTLTESAVVRQPAVLEAVLDAGATREQLGDRVRTVDLERGFFAVLEVALVCTVDFGAGLVERVDVELTYDHTADGTRVLRQGTFSFTDGVGPQRFRTDLAAPDQREVGWRTTVWYRGDPAPVVLEQPPTLTELVVVDLDGTGVLDVTVELRDVPYALVGGATVELEHPGTGQSARLVLDAAHPADRWTVVTRTTPGPVRYRTTWHRPADGDVAGPWVDTSERHLALDLPAELRPRTGVELVSAGDCSGLAQLLVELRAGEDAPAVPFTFTAAGQSASWTDPGLDPADLRYAARQVLVYADGHRDDLGFAEHDAPVLVVGDLLRFEVLVEPRLLDLGGTLRLALLELVSPAGETTTLVLRDRSVQQRWSFRMSAPGAPEYQYRLTVLPTTGDRTVLSRRSTRTGVLVLRYPEA